MLVATRGKLAREFPHRPGSVNENASGLDTTGNVSQFSKIRAPDGSTESIVLVVQFFDELREILVPYDRKYWPKLLLSYQVM